jgi:hypothetical protein
VEVIMMQTFFLTWWVMGLLSLIILTYEDYNNKKKTGLSYHTVDGRKNYYMLGATTFLLFISGLGFFGVLLTLLFSAGVVFFVRARKVFGIADISALGWLVTGWVAGGFGLYFLLTFLLILLLLYVFNRRVVLINDTPFFVFLLLCHVFSFLFYFL